MSRSRVSQVDHLLAQCISQEEIRPADRDQSLKRQVAVLNQLREWPLERMVALSPDFSQLTWQNSQGYTLDLRLDRDYPHSPPVCTSPDLPEALDLADWRSNSTWSDIWELFEAQMSSWGPILAQLREFDERAWVLESTAWSRRVVVEPLLSMQITCDPLGPNGPSGLPNIRFLGPDKPVQTYNDRLSARGHLFDPERALVVNLEKILEVEFPHPAEVAKEEFKIECCICFAHSLGSALPDLRCPFAKCHRAFHLECLYEWLRGTTQNNFSVHNFIHGTCPYCQSAITCPGPKT